MRILLFGIEPYGTGGIGTYTRPLAYRFTDLGHKVFFFFSGAYFKKYNWYFKPYLRVPRSHFPFEYAEVINCPSWLYNYRRPLLDVTEKRVEKLFTEYIEKIKPDVMHVHSQSALPASLLEIASKRGIIVVNTIHVYGYLCQKQVMIDYIGDSCEGPSDLEKCALCTSKEDVSGIKFKARLQNSSKTFMAIMVRAKRLVRRIRANWPQTDLRTPVSSSADPALVKGLANRLNYMIRVINSVADKTICVSEDVKKTLMRFDVREDRLVVQHIGSVIAETQKIRENEPYDPIVIGNIGGVGHYKGTQVLIDAVGKVSNNNFRVKIFGKYDIAFKSLLMDGRKGLPVEFTGQYLPEQLPGILEQVDVMVLPSICKDTAPQTIFESFSGGIPIIAPKIGGFPDFVQHDHNGLLFQAGNSDDLAEKIDYILNNKERLALYQQNIPRLKTIKENADELVGLYSELIRHRKDRQSKEHGGIRVWPQGDGEGGC